MTLVPIGGSYDYVQSSQPSSPSAGDTWLDTSVSPNGESKVYADFGSGLEWRSVPVEQELNSGRTRELLLLMQGKPVPEVVDPINEQSSTNVTKVNGDYELGTTTVYWEDVSDGDKNIEDDDWSGWNGDTGSLSVSSGVIGSDNDLRLEANNARLSVYATRSSLTTNKLYAKVRFDSQGSGGSNDGYEVRIESGGTLVGYLDFDHNGNDIDWYGTSYNELASDAWSPNTTYDLVFDWDFSNNTVDITINGTTYSGESIGDTSGYDHVEFINDTTDSGSNRALTFDDLGVEEDALTGDVTDQFASPTSEPADFKQWELLRAKDVTTGGSTAANPVQFDILNSSNSALNSTRIPKARIADEDFRLRDRVYSEDAGSDGQSDYTIATTGAGGHFGISILTVVSVKKNGNILDSDNWTFDDVDTVSVDTSNVTISSGDTIEIKYDFDVFDSTLRPKAYLNRASGSETSPSISHFRYEYVI